ncbi:MAG: hypothetical protein R2788_13960 [Saprospiraceae bacterium]
MITFCNGHEPFQQNCSASTSTQLTHKRRTISVVTILLLSISSKPHLTWDELEFVVIEGKQKQLVGKHRKGNGAR